ncbi:hypothetical protein [Mycobacterium attenuatum]|uniref:hypothetical protein n=1 Tax=Mycobacterium attenuatum TaxID=2341086 RepID=UPI000F0325C2|nr:hypothetical protein [Mycobacterium attenuatum]VBA60297.1 hypothetical protein LAUMK41_03928 [Mycobacterium attenuatum]
MPATTPTNPYPDVALPPGVSIDVEETSLILWGHDTGDELNPNQARQLAAALVAVADKLDGAR